MKQIIIGREGNQPFAINDDYVSRQHAIFTYDEQSGVMTLTDRSRSGTFIRMGNQYQQISQCNVDANTDVRLGPYFMFKISQLFQTPVKPSVNAGTTPPKPKPEKVDIAFLRKVAEEYEETKIKLEQKQSNINSLRGLSLTATLIGGAVTAILPQMLTKGEEKPELYVYVIGPAVALILLLALMLYCSNASKAIIAKKNKNEKAYKISFCCPKCHVPFAGKLYENILAEGKCPKCKVEFYDTQA